jgi:hypothetical protein
MVVHIWVKPLKTLDLLVFAARKVIINADVRLFAPFAGRCAMTWYFATWDETGESIRFSSIDAIVRYIMDYDLSILQATFIAVKPDGQWRDCGLLVDAALEEERLAAGYDREHADWASSAQRTGR